MSRDTVKKKTREGRTKGSGREGKKSPPSASASRLPQKRRWEDDEAGQRSTRVFIGLLLRNHPITTLVEAGRRRHSPQSEKDKESKNQRYLIL